MDSGMAGSINRDRSRRINRRAFAAVVGVGTSLRLLVVVAVAAHVPTSRPGDLTDQGGYAQTAIGWSHHRHLASLFNAPAYPIIIGEALRLSRAVGLNASVRTTAGVVQTAAAAGAIAGIGALGARRLSQGVGIGASLVLALWPNEVLRTGAVMTEGLATPLLCLAFVVIFWNEISTLPQAALAGLLLASTIAIRPALSPIVLVAAVLLVRRASPSIHSQPHLRIAAGYTVALALGLLPWSALAWTQLGTPAITTSSGFNVCMGNSVQATGAYTDRALRDCPHPRPGHEAADDVKLARRGVAWAVTHPLQEVPLLATRTVNTFGSDTDSLSYYPSSREWDLAIPQWTVSVVLQISWLTLIGAAWIGYRRRLPPSAISEVAVLCAAGLIGPLMTIGGARFHIPVVPLVCLSVGSLMGEWTPLQGVVTSGVPSRRPVPRDCQASADASPAVPHY